MSRPNEERDAIIVTRRRNGEPVAIIAADYGITPARVREVIQDVKWRRVKRQAPRWHMSRFDVWRIQRWAKQNADLFDNLNAPDNNPSTKHPSS